MVPAPCILLTGGTGFVGRYLAPRLTELFPEHRRLMLVRSLDGAPEPLWERQAVDFRDAAAIEAVIAEARPSLVAHLAAQSSVALASNAAEETWRVNVISTFTLARAVSQHAPGGVFFLTSTAEVYGASFLAGPAREDTPTAPTNSYAVSKLAAERILQDILPAETRLIIVRAFNHSGAGHDERFVLPSFAAQVARAESGFSPPRILTGNLAAERDFLHVEDVVEAYGRLLSMGVSDALPNRTLVNVASGRAWRLETLVDMLRAKARCPIALELDSSRMRPSDIPSVVGDASRLGALTGWSPALPAERILDDLLASYRFKYGG